MAQRFSYSHRPPSEALEKIVSCFHRSNKALYLGQVALEIGWSLERTQQMIELLVEDNVLRPATEDEKQRVNLSSHAVIYVLVESH